MPSMVPADVHAFEALDASKQHFQIAVMSDNHIPDTSKPAFSATCIAWAVANSDNLVALLTCGDNNVSLDAVNAANDYKKWIYSSVGGNLPASVPVLPTIGNHDTNIPWTGETAGPYDVTTATPHTPIQDAYSDLFQGNEWYSWDYGDLLRIAVIYNLTDYLNANGDTMYHNCNAPGSRKTLNPDHSGITIEGSAQRGWLDSVFKSSHPWKAVACHRAMWAPFNSDPRKMNKLARPAMKTPIDLGVSLICQGDTHTGYWSGPWYPGGADNELYVPPGGVGAYAMGLCGTYALRTVDLTALPNSATTVPWSSGANGAGKLGKVHVALIDFGPHSPAGIRIFEVTNNDSTGAVVYSSTITRNPGA